MTRAATSGTHGFLQIVRQIHVPQMSERPHAESESRENRESRRKGHREAVKPDFVKSRDPDGTKRRQHRDEEVRESYAQNRAE